MWLLMQSPCSHGTYILVGKIKQAKIGPRDMQCLLKTSLSSTDFQPDTSSKHPIKIK